MIQYFFLTTTCGISQSNPIYYHWSLDKCINYILGPSIHWTMHHSVHFNRSGTYANFRYNFLENCTMYVECEAELKRLNNEMEHILFFLWYIIIFILNNYFFKSAMKLLPSMSVYSCIVFNLQAVLGSKYDKKMPHDYTLHTNPDTNQRHISSIERQKTWHSDYQKINKAACHSNTTKVKQHQQK